MNYFNQHLTFKQSAAIIPKHQLQKGMIIQNRYRNLEDKIKDYMFLILNPEFRGKVHVLNLNEFSTIRFNELARQTGVRIIPKFRKRGLIIPKLIMKESSNRFYYSKLAVNMEKLYNNSYRTLFLNKMQLVQLIDYKFDEDIEDHYIPNRNV
tara:strand:+ start:895 stop:1350 length:456 start_codon:yes stop_codon:yes gene_type:complete